MASNAVPIGIFAAYMTTAASLTALCIRVILRHPLTLAGVPTRRPAIALFSLLAAISLATTWFYMFAYFRWSYNDWAATGNINNSELRLGDWLRDTPLFRQAWASALDTPARVWWTVQIFGFCACWSMVLSAQGTNRAIPHLWAFMLLGQIVAISFASNLSFVAMLVYPDRETELLKTQKARRRVSDRVILLVNLALALLLLVNLESSWFMCLLLAPHVLAFVPLLKDRVSPAEGSVAGTSKAEQFGLMAVLVAVATKRIVDHGGDLAVITWTLYEHPAASSVGWDVICCWVSFGAWVLLGAS